ncbi:MAG: ABC transporter permease, partial [Actinomycetota bacterium]
APILKSGLAYLPAELVLGGLALALYGLRPRLSGVAWAAYAAMTFIAFLGPGLNFDQWVLNLSPTTHVGNPPAGATQGDALTVMAVVAVALLAVGFAAFRRRGVPQS